MIIAAVALAALTAFLVLFHSIRKTSPSWLFGAAISLMGAALSFGFCLTSNLGAFEINAGMTSLIVTLFGSILLMKLSLNSKPEMQPVKVDSE